MALTKVTGSVIKDSVSLSGNVSVGGTLTYQDVTNVDALGIGTFRTGIKVLAGQVDVGSNIKLGNSGVITATSFVGSGANLTGIALSSLNINGNVDNRIITVSIFLLHSPNCLVSSCIHSFIVLVLGHLATIQCISVVSFLKPFVSMSTIAGIIFLL